MSSKIIDSVIARSRDMYEANDNKFAHFSFLTKRNKIISAGKNRMNKTHPLTQKFNNDYKWPFIHSELDCILRFPYRLCYLSDYDLYNVRVGNDGSIRMSRPCSDCANLLITLNVRRIYYTNQFGLMERLLY